MLQFRPWELLAVTWSTSVRHQRSKPHSFSTQTTIAFQEGQNYCNWLCLYSRLGQYRMLSRCISVLGGSQWMTQFSCSHFGWKLSWKLVLRFSPMWEPTMRTRTGKKHLWKERTQWVFTWKPKSSSQGSKQIWFIGFCCSSSYMGLLLLALLVFLLIWGCYSSLLLG